MGLGYGGVGKMVYETLVEYQKARVAFIDSVGTLLQKDDPVVLQTFLDADLVGLLTRPLIQDIIPTVQINSLNVVSRVSDLTDSTDAQFTTDIELAKYKTALTHPNTLVQQAACNTFTALARKSPQNADAVLSASILPEVSAQLLAVKPGPKEATLRLINTLVVSSVDVCDSVTGPDELADLVNNLHLPESTDVLKTIVCSNLADTAQYSEAFARRVVEAQALPAVAMQVCASSSSTKLAAAALLCLGQVAKHSDALAAEVLDQGVAQATLEAAMSQERAVRCNAALLLHECVRKTPELCGKTVADGGMACVARNLQLEDGHANALPTVLALGCVADFSVALSVQGVKVGATKEVIRYLRGDVEEKVRVAAAWTVARLARHGAEVAQPMAAAGVLAPLLEMYKWSCRDEGDPIMKAKAKEALKEVVHCCGDLQALEPLLDVETPGEILRHVLAEFASGLPKSVPMKRSFVTSGALMRMLRLAKDLMRLQHVTLENRSAAFVQQIAALFPPDVVSYYSEDS